MEAMIKWEESKRSWVLHPPCRALISCLPVNTNIYSRHNSVMTTSIPGHTEMEFMYFMCLLKALGDRSGETREITFIQQRGPLLPVTCLLSIFSWNLATALKSWRWKFNKRINQWLQLLRITTITLPWDRPVLQKSVSWQFQLIFHMQGTRISGDVHLG